MVTAGEKGWLKVFQRNKREKWAEKYMRQHNGQLPPVSVCTRIQRAVCCCFFSEPLPGTWAAKNRQKSRREKKGKGGKEKGKKKGKGAKKYH